MANKKLDRAFRKSDKRKENKVTLLSGELGIPLNGRKLVEVPNRQGFVFVRLKNNTSELIQAYNAAVSPIYDLPVLVARQVGVYKVVGRNVDRYTNQWGQAPYLPKHGAQHSFNPDINIGGDIVWVYSPQFMPLLAYPSGSSGSPRLTIAPYTIRDANGAWKYVGNTGTPDTTLYNPTTGSRAVMGLVYLDTVSGNPQFLINSGTYIDASLTGSNQVVDYIPQDNNPSHIPLAAFRLVSGTSQLSWNNVYDVRPFLHVMTTGSSGGSGGTGSSGFTAWDEGIPQGNATILNVVGADASISVSGSVAQLSIISASSCGTYQRFDQPVSLQGGTGTLFKVPEGVYASGSLGVFYNGVLQLKGYGYEELIYVSGTYQLLFMPTVGASHMVSYGIPCTSQTYSTGTGVTLRAVSINNNSNPNVLLQYPLPIYLTGSNFNFSISQSDGSDIRVLDSDGITNLPYHIRNYDSINQVGEVWARIDFIPSGSTKTIYLSQGNSSSPYQLPPTGKFARPTSSVASGLVENMVFDSSSNKYYVVTTTSPDTGPVKLYSSNSPTGSWTDMGTILNVGSAGQWDDTELYAPYLVKDGSTWYLFYTGGPDGTQNSHSIGFATSSTITGTYTRSASNPVMTYSGIANWKQYRAAEPSVFYSNILNAYVMIYMGDAGNGSASQLETVGYATAPSITGSWTDYTNNPVISYVSVPDWRSNIVADPFVIEIGTTAYIFVGAGLEGYAWQLGVFKTTDYVTFTEIGVVYGVGLDTTYTSKGVIRCGISKFNNDWYLTFTGFDGTNFAWAVGEMFGMSTSKGYDPLQVFDYFDDFNGSTLDANLWGSPSASNAGSITISGSVMSIQITSGNAHRTVDGFRSFGVRYLTEALTRQTTADGTDSNWGESGFADDDRNPAIRLYQDGSAKAVKENLTNSGVSTSSDMAQNYTTTWAKRSVAFVNATGTMFRNDTNAWETINSNVPDRVMKPWLFAYRQSSNVSFEVDYLIVRKYANPEPIVTIV